METERIAKSESVPPRTIGKYCDSASGEPLPSKPSQKRDSLEPDEWPDISKTEASNHGPYPFGLAPPLRDVEQLLIQTERGRDILAHRYRRLHVLTEECSQELAAKFKELKLRADIAKEISALRDRPTILPELMTYEQAAIYLGESVDKVRKLVHLGEFRVRRGNPDLGEGPTTPHKIVVADLDEWIKKNTERL